MTMINPQKQPTSWACVHTCIAMLLDVPVQKVIDDLTGAGFPAAGLEDLQIINALSRYGVVFNQFVFDRLVAYGYYLLSVPSLNKHGYLHCVLVEFKEDNQFVIYDPSPNNQYTPQTLRGWHAPILVWPGGKLPK